MEIGLIGQVKLQDMLRAATKQVNRANTPVNESHIHNVRWHQFDTSVGSERYKTND